MPEYSLLTVISIAVVLIVEWVALRTGVLRMASYWISLVIVMGFQVAVDGWLTKLSSPIVLYDETQTLGVRFPWDIPIEDFGFTFSMFTLTTMLWLRATARRRAGDSHGAE